MVSPPQVVVQAPQTFTVVADEEKWSPCHLVTSAIALFCQPCCLCGLAAFILSLMSYTDHRVKNFEEYRSKRWTSYCLGITAIVGGVIGSIIILTIVIIVVKESSQVAGSIVEQLNNANAGSGGWNDGSGGWN